MTYYLIAIDSVGIQPYLFGSNRLRENIGASEIVARVTERWVYETVVSDALGFQHNLDGDNAVPAGYSFNQKRIKEDALDVEIIYAGGGNAVLIFGDETKAKLFTTQLTERVITDAPGLQIVVNQLPFKWPDSDNGDEPLSQMYKNLMQALAYKKATRQPSAPLLGVSVTANCQSTGLPAVYIDQEAENRMVAADIWAKLAHRDAADNRMELLFGLEQQGFTFAKDFNQIGTSHEASYIAVIHADGNGVSQRIDAIAKAYPTCADNRAFIEAMRSFSEALKKIAANSMKQIVGQLTRLISSNKKLVYRDITLELKRDEQLYVLPLRPLVIGGDDVTFVCDGRLALSLAALYLEAFRAEAEKEIEQHQADQELHACAGVAIVHNHYPFARAYELSEALCGQAKRYARKAKRETELGVSALDWHFAINGLLEDLSTIRKYEYTVTAGPLFNRPVRLTQPQYDPVASWQTFHSTTVAFQKYWDQQRSKMKALFQILRQGPEATRQYLEAYELTNLIRKTPEVLAEFQQNGWSNGSCGFLTPWKQ
ncbi:MAG: hypothetical protein HC875_31375 [Anaerolineales bacterium]|nr:hypothetical protein [Anaerolineales bacterium]